MKTTSLSRFFFSILVGCAFGAATTLLAACSSDDDKDMTPPTITDRGITANPINCQVYHPGDTIAFRYLFEDNEALGSYNIEIHNNFEHHSHSTEANDHEGTECSHDSHAHATDEELNSGATLWTFSQDYAIPEGLLVYKAANDIVIPRNVSHGDYHFMIRLTDRAGWQQLKAIAIIIEE